MTNLNGPKPSQYKSLAEPDDILSTGMNGFQMLFDHAKKFPKLKKQQKFVRKVSGISKVNIL